MSALTTLTAPVGINPLVMARGQELIALTQIGKAIIFRVADKKPFFISKEVTNESKTKFSPEKNKCNPIGRPIARYHRDVERIPKPLSV